MVKTRKLRKRQQDILALLTAYDELTTQKIIELLYPNEEIYKDGKLNRQSSKYGSVARTLRSLQKRNLIVKVTGQTVWKKTK